MIENNIIYSIIGVGIFIGLVLVYAILLKRKK